MQRHTGHCACGAIGFSALGEAIRPHYCHCDTCRRCAGAPVVAWVNFAADGFAWRGEQPTWFASSAVMRRGFCPHCGSSLCTVEDDGYVCVTVASLDHPELVAPGYHINVQHALPWLKLEDGLRREVREDRA